ncbi:MAG: glycosyl hydrolase family 28-related protein, partial [Lachnospiraceae bacterium]
MNVRILNLMARNITIELEGNDAYQMEAYDIWLNGSYLRTDNKMVLILNGLKPSTKYELSLKREDRVLVSTNFTTKVETYTLNVRQFGAIGDGVNDDTQALQAAILCCPE